MTDEELDRHIADMARGLDQEIRDAPTVQAAQRQLVDAVKAAQEDAARAAEAAAQAERERRAADPRYARDFDRTECWPECKPSPASRATAIPYVHHTQNLGFCLGAWRPKTQALDVYVDLEDILSEEENQYTPSGLAAYKTADVVLLWLAQHPEVIPRIWPDH